jgi:hypothetical protein
MSTAIAIPGLRLVKNDGYEPVSDGGRAIQLTWSKQRNFLSKSAADWAPALEAALRDIRNECRDAGWDGDDAVPVTDRTINIAASVSTALFDLLPKGTPAPDLIPESDGDICISWPVNASRIFSVSVGEHGRVNFAGQFGSEGGVHAWQSIDATNPSTLEESLDDVVRYVRRLYGPIAIRRAA